MQILQFPDSSWGLTVLKNIFLRFIGLNGLKMGWKKSSLIWNFFPWFWLKNPVFPWFPWLEKVFKIFPEFPDFPDRWEPWRCDKHDTTQPSFLPVFAWISWRTKGLLVQIPAPLGKKSLYVKVKNIILSIHVHNNKFLRIVIMLRWYLATVKRKQKTTELTNRTV